MNAKPETLPLAEALNYPDPQIRKRVRELVQAMPELPAHWDYDVVISADSGQVGMRIVEIVTLPDGSEQRVPRMRRHTLTVQEKEQLQAAVHERWAAQRAKRDQISPTAS